MQNEQPRILIVDDKAENRALLEIYLDDLSVEIDEAESGLDCLQKLQENPYAMVILDVQMPGMDGFEVLERMRSTPEIDDIPVIFVSAIFDSDEYILRGIEGGAVDFIPKPVNGMILTSKVSNFIGLYEKQKKLDLLVRKLERSNQRLKENERKFKRITQSANDGIILLNASRQIRFWNTAATQIFGYNKFEKLSEEFIELLIAPHFRPTIEEHFEQLLTEHNKYQAPIRLTAIDSKGVNLSIELSLSLFQTADSQTNYTVIIRDMTQRDKIEKEAQQAKELRETNKVIKEFMDNVSHELRTPMNAIIGISNMLSKYNADNLTEKQIEGLEIINSSGSRLLDMINDVLDISRIESNRIEVLREEFNLDQILATIKSIVLSLIDQKDLKFIIKKSTTVPETIVSDSKKLQQILINLLSNAVKFTPEGKVQLYIHLTDNNLHFEITDTGIGIEKKDLNRIFERFQQIDNTASKEYKGTGLGLNIVSKLVELLRGEISVDSTPGEGTTMKFYLPITSSTPDAETCTTDNTTKLSWYCLDEFDKNLAFIVDSNKDNQFLFTNLLREANFRVISCSDASLALHTLDEVSPDMLILNLEMAKIHGTSILNRLKSIGSYSSLPILAYTSFQDIKIDTTGLNARIHKGVLKEPVLISIIQGFNLGVKVFKETAFLCFYEDENHIYEWLPEESESYHNFNYELAAHVFMQRKVENLVIDSLTDDGENLKLLSKLKQLKADLNNIYILANEVSDDVLEQIKQLNQVQIITQKDMENVKSITDFLATQ